jgi:hypothetical protein
MAEHCIFKLYGYCPLSFIIFADPWSLCPNSFFCNVPDLWIVVKIADEDEMEVREKASCLAIKDIIYLCVG